MSQTNSAERTASDKDERTAARGGAWLSRAADPGPQSRSPRSPAIHTVGLSKRFGNAVAVNSLSMTVERGEVFGFLGPNGAGKTTAVKLLLGLARPTGGEAMVLGAPLGDRETRRRIGYLPELFRFQAGSRPARCSCCTAGSSACRKSAWEQEGRQRLADGRVCSIARDDKVGTFSKGMQQRLGLGVALLGDPALVVLDEPTSALDPVGRHDVRQIIRELRERGTTVFLNTHLLEEAEHVCDRVAVIDKGRAHRHRARSTELLGGSHRGCASRCGPRRGLVAVGLGRFGRWQPATATGSWSRASSRVGFRTSSPRSSPWADASRPSSPSTRASKTGSSSCWGNR